MSADYDVVTYDPGVMVLKGDIGEARMGLPGPSSCTWIVPGTERNHAQTITISL
jgi:hypothetical protein